MGPEMEMPLKLADVGTPEQPTIRKRLEWERANLQRRLEHVDAALAILDRNSGIEEFHDAIVKTGLGYR